MSEHTSDDLHCPRCGELPEPLLCLGHKADGTPSTDTPAAMLALEAELGLADDTCRPATGTTLTDAQTAVMLRAMSDDPELGTGNGEHGR
ncbi:hypothetical protein GCM10018785_27430 [Streptomyces longispororuber]|uniref:Uncharacterized protein n=1 Tax=Streptomyces longispororuber TaxID=68230 RepID=A0A918ZJM5_9ACTN|nr:hypothetical protein [Streptomyces longispororuber]GHE56619.1 hypothetical protein GCM10018785_27430 [Streptomyces longispororuber]